MLRSLGVVRVGVTIDPPDSRESYAAALLALLGLMLKLGVLFNCGQTPKIDHVRKIA